MYDAERRIHEETNIPSDSLQRDMREVSRFCPPACVAAVERGLEAVCRIARSPLQDPVD